jgi:serine/threonine protein phosphatase 1
VNLPLFKSFPVNPHGPDYAVGDLHGCYDALDRLLKRVNFHPAKNRLFAVGDLTDRGPASEAFEHYLKQPWFDGTRGNHDQMLIDAAQDDLARENWVKNGGAWAWQFTQEELTRWRDLLDTLPLAIEVATPKGLVGIVHADPLVPTWRMLRDSLTQLRRHPDSLHFYSKDAPAKVQEIMWSRELAKQMAVAQQSKHPMAPIPDLRALVIGHTAARAPIQVGNIWMIDTGAGYARSHARLTLLNLHTFEVYAEPTHLA